METASVRAVLFAKDLEAVAAFYVGALALTRLSGDKDHAILECDGFELVVHQIPTQIADTIVIAQPPIRRVWGAIRLDFPVASIADSRKLARAWRRDRRRSAAVGRSQCESILRPRPRGQPVRRQPTEIARGVLWRAP